MKLHLARSTDELIGVILSGDPDVAGANTPEQIAAYKESSDPDDLGHVPETATMFFFNPLPNFRNAAARAGRRSERGARLHSRLFGYSGSATVSIPIAGKAAEGRLKNAEVTNKAALEALDKLHAEAGEDADDDEHGEKRAAVETRLEAIREATYTQVAFSGLRPAQAQEVATATGAEVCGAAFECAYGVDPLDVCLCILSRGGKVERCPPTLKIERVAARAYEHFMDDLSAGDAKAVEGHAAWSQRVDQEVVRAALQDVKTECGQGASVPLERGPKGYPVEALMQLINVAINTAQLTFATEKKRSTNAAGAALVGAVDVGDAEAIKKAREAVERMTALKWRGAVTAQGLISELSARVQTVSRLGKGGRAPSEWRSGLSTPTPTHGDAASATP